MLSAAGRSTAGTRAPHSCLRHRMVSPGSLEAMRSLPWGLHEDGSRCFLVVWCHHRHLCPAGQAMCCGSAVCSHPTPRGKATQFSSVSLWQVGWNCLLCPFLLLKLPDTLQFFGQAEISFSALCSHDLVSRSLSMPIHFPRGRSRGVELPQLLCCLSRIPSR